MSHNCQAEGSALGIELNEWIVDIETNVSNCEAEGRATGIGLNSWVADVESDVKSFSLCDEEEDWTATSIYRVPSYIRDIRENVFTPSVVSFGPYHNNASRLRPMEKHKRRALVHFLKMASKPLDHFIQAMRAIKKQLQDSYHNLDKKWKDPRDPGQFLMLMILDGCFMLEVMRMTDDKYREMRYATHDPIFGIDGVNHRLPYIKRDMLLMENQLPLLVLKMLLEVEGLQSDADDASINNMVLQFFGVSANITGLGLHPLDLYRKSLLHSDAPPKTSQLHDRTQSSDVLPSATELPDYGVKFRKSESTSLTDIHFEGSVLSLPLLLVDDNTECALLNSVALEHLHVGTGSEVTSYVCFMDEIIHSAKDVSLLHREGIMKIATGGEKSVAAIFRSLSKEGKTDPQCRLRAVRKRVHEFCQRPWSAWHARLKQDYFKNPWTVITFVGGIVIVNYLAAAQTFYTIYQYYHPHPAAPGS